MTYTPINEHVFAAAMSGALSGIGIGERPITSTVSADYSGLALAAFAYAEEFDTQWATTAIDELIWGAINTASCNYFENRNKLSIAPIVYTNEVAAIIAAIKEGDAIAIEGGATIPAWPPGGGGSGTVTDVTGTAPIIITGSPTVTPNVTISPATDSTAGSLSAADKTKLDSITTIVTSVAVTAPITNSGSSTAPDIGLANSGTPTGTFGDGTHVATITVDAQGIVTNVVSTPITTGGAGTVTDVTGTAPVSVATGTTTPVVSLAMADNTILIGQIGGGSPAAHAVSGDATLSDTGVLTFDTVNPDVGTFGDGTHVAQVTVDAKGRITSVTDVGIPLNIGTVVQVTGTAPMVATPGGADANSYNVALTAPVADWQGNTATINVTGTAAVALTSNFTPAVSGKMDVIISGVLECAESSVTDHPFTIGISQGAGPSSGVYELATIPHVQNAATGGTPGSTPFSLVCSLDKITVVGPPVTFPVGTPAILNAVVVGDDSGQMTISAKGLQMKVQERFA